MRILNAAVDIGLWTLRICVIGGALLYILLYLAIALLRLNYPFELEWLEGSILEHVRGLLDGRKLYAAPSLEHVSPVYTPLYYYLSAIVSAVVGVGFVPLRLISLLASFGIFLFIYLLVHSETKRVFPALLAVGLFAGTFRLGGAWLDIARVDSLCLFFLLWGAYVLRVHHSACSHVAAGLLLSLALLTKQTVIAVILLLMAHVLYRDWRLMFVALGTVVTVVGVSSVLLNYLHDGWYLYYVFDLIRQEAQLDQHKIAGFWSDDLIFPLPFVFLVLLATFLYLLLRERGAWKRFSFSFFLLAGMVGMAWSSRIHVGGYDNVLIPAYAGVAVMFGLAVHALLSMCVVPQGSRRFLCAFLYLLCVLQFTALWYDPRANVPTRYDFAAGHQLVALLKSIDGEVFFPHHGYLATLAGKKSYLHRGLAQPVLYGVSFDSQDAALRARLSEEIERAVREQRFAAIILDDAWFQHVIDRYYVLRSLTFDSPTVFVPVTGLRVRPQFLYLPKRL